MSSTVGKSVPVQYGCRSSTLELLEFTMFNNVLGFKDRVSDTHKQSTGFLRNAEDELSVLYDSVQKFFLGDGQTVGEGTLLISAVYRVAYSKEDRPK